jgi:hypothetical protein
MLNKRTKFTEPRSESDLLEKIKHVTLIGRGNSNRGQPSNVEFSDIHKYFDKNNNYISSGPDPIEQYPEYMEELYQERGMIGKETMGTVYWISTTNPNTSMTDPVSGVTTSFQYKVMKDGQESLIFDAIPSGDTWNIGGEGIQKIENSSLRKIVEVINPNSRLL